MIPEPKAARSRRRVELTALAVDALRRRRVAQTEERLRLGGAWLDRDLMFANEAGDYLSDAYRRRQSFRPVLERASLPPMRLHDLRHLGATLLLG